MPAVRPASQQNLGQISDDASPALSSAFQRDLDLMVLDIGSALDLTWLD
jgi:hypothetical protein